MNHLCCGIDIAKDTAVFSLLDHDGKPLSSPTTFKNTTSGFKIAIKWLRKFSKPFKPYEIHIVM